MWAVAFSPDGKTLASAGRDSSNPGKPGELRLWDAATGETRYALKGHEGAVYAVAFGPTARPSPPRAGPDGAAVRCGDRRDPPPFKGHENPVWAVAFSPDGKTLASAGGELMEFGQTWRVAAVGRGDRRDPPTLKGHEGAVLAVAFSPDGKTLASAGGDRTVWLWDAGDRRDPTTLKGHEGAVYAVAFSPDGKTLASAGDDWTGRLWDAATGEIRATLKGHENPVWAVAFSPDGKTLASAGDDSGRCGCGMRRPANHAAFKGHEGPVWAVAFSPDGKTLASAGGDSSNPGKPGELRLWDAATGENRATLKGHEGAVWAVAFSPDGKTLASASRDGTVRLWQASFPSGSDPPSSSSTRRAAMGLEATDIPPGREMEDLGRRYRALLAAVQGPDLTANETSWDELTETQQALDAARARQQQQRQDAERPARETTGGNLGTLLGPETTGLKVTTALRLQPIPTGIYTSRGAE